MTQVSTEGLLREVARLFVQAQREDVACCGGTTLTQCSIITEVGRAGELTLAELGRKLGYDKSWTSRAVETLVQERLLSKVPSETDRRNVLISLSPAGKTRLEELNQTLNAQSARIMHRIPAEERKNVYGSLELLLGALRAEEEEASQEGTQICQTN